MPSCPRLPPQWNPWFARYTAQVPYREGVSSKSPPFGAQIAEVCGNTLRLGRGLALLLGRLDNRCKARYVLALAQTHHDHALRRPARALDVVDRHPDDGATI